jgi:hypothetical protein
MPDDRPTVRDAESASRELAWDRLWSILLSNPPADDEADDSDQEEVS